ncbi:unnamed protein product [Diamesa serratosioi]
MVKAISKRKKIAENDPIRQKMLKDREEHARGLGNDYSHVFRRKTRMELIRLSLIIMGIEFAYAAETAFVSPILLSIGIEHKHMTMVWALSPILGFFFSPLLGSITDRCSSKVGRRRPLMAILGVGLLFGLILAPYGRVLGELLGDNGSTVIVPSNLTDVQKVKLEYKTYDSESVSVSDSNSFYWAIVLTILGTVLLDFNADNCQTPSRAYLLDMCVQEEHAKALSTYTIMAGIGGCLGYSIGAVDWNSTIFANLIGDNIRTVFTLVAILFTVCFIFSVTTFREIPLKLMESDEMLRPVTQLSVKKEKEKLKAKAALPTTTFTEIEKPETLNGSDEDDDDQDESVTLMMYLRSIIYMPRSLRILCITNCLSWMGHISYCLYFTDFVGESVFKGDPYAPVDSLEYDLYDQGIRFGCWGLAIYALTCALYSMMIEKLIQKFSAKRCYVGGLLIFGVGMALCAHYPSKLGVLLFSMTAGVVYATIFTIPFLLVATYHGKGTFKTKTKESNDTIKTDQPPEFQRGLGTDCGIVSSMLFIAQFVISLSIGSFITLIESTAAVLYTASIFSFFAAISACYVVYMDL